jgi:adenylosuccinate synthase
MINGVTQIIMTKADVLDAFEELHDDTGEMLRKVGSEFGATTGRPRRCGWIDLVALNFACMINGVTQIVMTKADVLDGFEELNVCESYRINGKEQSMVPYQMMKTKIEPVLKSFNGWQSDITKIKSFDVLPGKMKEYIAHINQFLGVPVTYISNGPGRDQLIQSPGV